MTETVYRERCPEGRKLFELIEKTPYDGQGKEKYHAVQAYFYHVGSCPNCGPALLTDAPPPPTVEELQAESKRLTASLARQCDLGQDALTMLHDYELLIDDLQRQVELYRRAAFMPREAREED